jgi:hypothetical protein
MINKDAHKLNPYFWQMICLTVSTIIFSLILLNRSPNLLRPSSMALRTGFGLVIPFAALCLYLSFRIPPRIGDLISMAVTLSFFAMPLAGLWASGQSQSTILSGVIPLFDADSYFTDALRLMDGKSFSIFSARRPLFPGLLAVLLTLTGRNLMAALAILTALTGLACYFTAREIQRTHGAEIAVFILMVLFLFNRAHSGISMSESLGIALGTLGFGLLWRGASTKSLFYLWSGLLTTTLAMNARAGAFFILPILILWTGWLLRENNIIPWRVLFTSAGAVILGFLLNLILTRVIAVPSGVPFANFSYTLYGLASGGRSWAYVFEAHPEVLGIQEPEQSKKIYQLAFDLIRANPLQTVQGAIFNWKMLFSNSWYNMYAYIGGENWIINIFTRRVMYVLCIVGIFAWFQDRKDPIQSLIMVSAIGVFISVPFLPPSDAYRMRPYAASIVIFGALPAMGLTYLIHGIKTKYHDRTGKFLDKNIIAQSRIILAYSFVLVSVTLIGPIIVKSIAKPLPSQTIPCASDLTSILVNFDGGTYINLKKQNDPFLDWMPNFHAGDFRRNSHSLADSYLIAWAESIEPPKTIFLTLDYHNDQKAMIVMPTILLPKTGTFMQICGQWETNPNLMEYAIFYGKEIQIIHPK